MRNKILPLIAAALLVGSASIASAQSPAPGGQEVEQDREQSQGRTPATRSQQRAPGTQQRPMQGAGQGADQVQGQMPSGTTGIGSDQNTLDKGAQTVPDDARPQTPPR